MLRDRPSIDARIRDLCSSRLARQSRPDQYNVEGHFMPKQIKNSKKPYTPGMPAKITKLMEGESDRGQS
jgi:hypothetical protein